MKEKRNIYEAKTLIFAKGILQFNFSVKLNPLGNIQGVYEVTTSFPLSQDVLFFSLRRTTSDLLSKSLCFSFVWLLVAVMSLRLCTGPEDLPPLTGHISGDSYIECFVSPLEADKIPLSPHYSTNCNCPGEKLLLFPDFHSITLHPNDSPL